MPTADEFKAGLRGQLLSPGDESYDRARKLWNGMFDRRPALIARCAGAADVIRAVSFARDHRLAVAGRGNTTRSILSVPHSVLSVPSRVL